MLELRNITKDYETGPETVHALRGISLSFRKSEFVSILGQSGCGKTTLLNIMGGLDHYTDGDLIINGTSTKKYKDADWDAYRNHSIGFVFQSYNLIPHQTVLANVELALTLAGISSEERKNRALDALDAVGLKEQAYKSPNQLSGGQMQRVAIARALINNPDILLADEPTGALDSETSVQIMELLQQIASNRLVIMVTHNPELAEAYSTRIIKLSDGLVIGDSAPFDGSESIQNENRLKNKSMSMKTALGLSFNNLLTKKARTILTAFAGSIGIIGIALILSVSSGFQNYIDKIENDTLSSYPLTITSESADMTSMLSAFSNAKEEEKRSDGNTVKEKQLVSQMFAHIGTNDLKSFNTYFKNNKASLGDCFEAISYDYGISPQIYATDMTYGVVQVNPSKLMPSRGASSGSSVFTSKIFHEIIDNETLLTSQYDILAGQWPKKYNEMVLVLQENGELSDYMAYALGLKDPAEMQNMVNELMKGKEVSVKPSTPKTWTYDDLLNLEFTLIPQADKYRYNSAYNVYEDLSDNKEHMTNLIKSGEKLKITCVVCPQEGTSSTAMTAGVGYLPSLSAHVIETAKNKEIVKKQLADHEHDVFSGKSFDELKSKNDSALGFENLMSVDANALGNAMGMDISEDDIKNIMMQYSTKIGSQITADCSSYETAVTASLETLCNEIVRRIIEQKTDPETGMINYSAEELSVISAQLMSGEKFVTQMQELSSKTGNLLSADAFAQIFYPLLGGYTQVLQQFAGIDIPQETLQTTVQPYVTSEAVQFGVKTTAQNITEGIMKKNILTDVGNLTMDITGSMASAFHVDQEAIASAFSFNMDEEEFTRLIQSYMSSDETTSFDGNLTKLGYADPEDPKTISFYLKDFTSKESFIDFIDKYNKKMESESKDDMIISYTDLTGILMSSVKTITNSVSYVLIAFVAISLIVSSIMIGVITYISVLERTKEIGILRAIGASKKDIMRVFNSETIIVGFLAGLIGILCSLLLLIPINAILYHLTEIAALKAVLPVAGAVILIVISVFLTFIAGLIPSRMAAKKDPVEALRTE